MLSIKNKLLLAVAVLLISACGNDEEYVLTIEERPVVECYLFAGDSARLKISRYISSVEATDAEVPDLDELDVKIKYNDSLYTLYPQGDGIYKDVYGDVQIREGGYYELSFSYGAVEVYAMTQVLDKPMNAASSVSSVAISQFDPSGGGFPSFPDPVEITWDNPDNSYYLVVVENIEEDPEPLVELEDGEEPPERVFRNTPMTSNLYLIRAMSFQYYGYHNVIIYHLNADYAALYEDNGSSSLDLVEIESSIENAYGIFTGISADTLTIKVTEAK